MAGASSPSGWASLFDLAFTRSDNPMALTDLDRRILAVNQAFVEDSGFSRAELLGRTLDSLTPWVTQEQRDMDWRQLARTGQLEANREVLHADGERTQAQFAARLASLAGRNVILVVQLWHSTRPLRIKSVSKAARGVLTQREREVIARIAMGRRAHEIAEELYIAPTTVRTHIRNAMAKVGAHTQAQLVACALTTGTLDSERFRQIAEAHPPRPAAQIPAAAQSSRGGR